MYYVWKTPGGNYSPLFHDMLQQKHLLIAGATGSGKSVVINGIIYTAILDSPAQAQFIFIDPKRVELCMYKRLPHCMLYASEPDTMIRGLQLAMSTTEQRYKEMQKKGLRKFDGSHIYVIIDELADLMTTQKKAVMPLIQRLCQIGRAANVHVFAATQCPIAKVIPTEIKVNFDSRVALHTRSKQDSRNITGFTGCECLPEYGECYYLTPKEYTRYKVPFTQDHDIQRLLGYWKKHSKPRIRLFKRG